MTDVVTTVRAPMGAKVHGVRAVGEAGNGETACRMRARGWVVEHDRPIDCARCRKALGLARTVPTR